MKSNRKKRIIAAVLCMVMVLSSSISALAGEEIFVDIPEASEAFTSEPMVVTEAEPAAESLDETEVSPEISFADGDVTADTETEAPVDPISETPVESAPETPEENTAEEPLPETPSDDVFVEEEAFADFGDGTTNVDSQVFSEETELKQEFVDEAGNVVQRVTAKLPAGAFAAETSSVTMEVSYLDADSENYLKSMMNENIQEGMQLGSYVFFNVQFKVNGEKADALKPVVITIEGSGLTVTDAKKANVFYFDPADPSVEGDRDELKEIPQRAEVLESLQAAGQSTENIEDYDLSEITFREDGTTDKVIFEGRKSTIYGCYTEEAKPVEEIPAEPTPIPEEPTPAPEETTPSPEEPGTEEPAPETVTEIEIISDEVNLRTEPNAEADNVAAVAYTGERFPLLENVQMEDALWYKIQYTYPETGETAELYVRSDFAKIVDESLEVTDDEAVDLTEEPGMVNELTYEDDKITVSVSAAEEGIIPDGASLSVKPITAENAETQEQYEEVAQHVEEKVTAEEKEVAGFLAYDISFLDAEGNKVEPNGEVKVSMNYKQAAIPETVTEEKAETTEVSVFHLEEDETGAVQNVVDMTAEGSASATVQTTENAEIQSAEFHTTSFSVYTVVWKDHGSWYHPTATLHFYNEKGDEISEKLGVSDKTIQIEGTGNLDSNSADHKNLNEIGEQYSGENGYYYKETHLDSYNSKQIADDISYNPGDNNGYDWHYNHGGSWHGWKYYEEGQNNEVNVYLIYTTEKPELLSKVATIDAASKGVTMKMIDLGGNGDEKTLINGSSMEDFGPNSGYSSDNVSGKIKSGLLNSKITDSNGFPTVKSSGKSLGRLFDGAKEVNYLFRKDIYDASGYFEYSSFENYAYLGSGNTFNVYKQIGTPSNTSSYFYQRGNFMPYNQIEDGKFSTNRNLYDENGNSLSPGAYRYNEKLYKTQGDNNFQFGMLVEAEFTQQRDGMATHNGSSSPMIYEFNGDDDLWVFIDDVLVLDIGGIHDAHSGSINFSTGKVVWYDCAKGGTPIPYETTLRQVFANASVLPSGKAWTSEGAEKEFEGNTFADYTTDHSFKMYYFERGEGASNLHVKFNLPTIPKNSVNVQKVVQNQNGEDVTYAEDIDFLFQIEIDDKLHINQPYDIVEGNNIVGHGTTDENAQFTLKHNQIARFNDIEGNKKYQVRELGAYLDGYQVQVDGTTIWTPDNGESHTGAESPEYNADEKSTVVFINQMEKSASLSITKKLTEKSEQTDKEFQIELKLGDKLYTGGYKIGSTTYTANNGIIKLKAGQTATITGLPYGITFSARELIDGSYIPTYGITNEDGVTNIQLPAVDENGNSNGITSASAQINGENCTLTVTNDEIPVGAGSTSVTVKKEWKNMSGVPIPNYVDIYLYKDVNHNGILDDGDTDMGYEPIRLNGGNQWSGEFKTVPGDTDYVLKEVYPPGYELIETTSDNSFDQIATIGDRHTPNNMREFNFGVNNFLLVKETGNKYFLWTPVQLNFDDEDLAEITETIRKLGLNGAGNLTENLTYKYGTVDFNGISLEQQPNGSGWHLSFSDTSVWSMFWALSYHRNQNIALTNSLDRTANTSIKVEKRWKGDNGVVGRPNKVTVQLYKNGTVEDAPVDLNSQNQWKHTFENLPIYTTEDEGRVIKNVYTVKETMIGNEKVDENGRALGYQSSVEEIVDTDGVIKFVITNIKDWQIVKVSENSNDVTLEAATFKLTKDNLDVAYGKSGSDGVVSWYSDENCSNPYGMSFGDGTYTLEETKAPSGYMKSNEKWTIQINSGSVKITSSDGTVITPIKSNGKDTFYFKNKALYDLPSTGGNGIYVYMIGGVALMMAAMFILYKMKDKGVPKS